MIIFSYTKQFGGESINLEIEGLQGINIPLSAVYPGIDLATIVAEDDALIESGQPQIREACVIFENQWFDFRAKAQEQGGKIIGEGMLRPLADLYSGWPGRLDHKQRVLKLDDSAHLNAKDLTALSLLASGHPRQSIADKMFVSLKAIEKRLTKIKERLNVVRHRNGEHCDWENDTLLGHLNHFDLLPFLLANSDWFSPKAFFRTINTSTKSVKLVVT